MEWPDRDVFSDEGRIWSAEIIPVVKKSGGGMHLAGGNNPCGRKQQARDASGRSK